MANSINGSYGNSSGSNSEDEDVGPIGMPIGRNTGIMQDLSIDRIFNSVVQLADDMDYFIEQKNGQRQFGPPLSWSSKNIPDQSCEVFVGNIPKNVYEDRLIPLLSVAGSLYQFRLMMGFNGLNRGFGFALYCDLEGAEEACRLLNGYQITREKQLGVVKCMDNCALLISNIPPQKTSSDIISFLFRRTVDVCHVFVTLPNRYNRRSAVIRYCSHRSAALARRYLISAGSVLWHQHRFAVIVDWRSRHHVDFPVNQIDMIGYQNDGIITVRPANIFDF